MKKTTVLSILQQLITWTPIFVYGCFNIEQFYSTAEKGITISAIVVIGAVLFVLKDKVKNWLKSPSAFTYIAILWVLSLIFVVLGNAIFEISSVLLASFLAALPMEAWRNALNQETIDNENFNKFKELLKK